MWVHAEVMGMVLYVLSSNVSAASEDTFTPFVRGSYGYDSNLLRLENDQEAIAVLGTTDTAESYYTLAAGIDMNLPVSRQHFLAHAEFNQTRFDKYTRLNYNGREVLLQWNWLLSSAARGEVGVSESLKQGSYSELRQPVSNLVKTRRSFFSAALNSEKPWQINFGLDRTRLSNEASQQQTQDSTVDTASAGLQYNASSGTQIEGMTQHAKGKYPTPQSVNTTPVNNSYEQWDNGVRVKWSPSFKTHFNGRLNYTARRYDDVPARNFSGVTGRLGVKYDATDKTTLNAALYREIGAVLYTTASYAIDEGMLVGAEWKPTVKIASFVQLSQGRIHYAGDPGIALSSSPERRDRLTALQAGLSYQIWRNTALSLVLQRGALDSNQALKSYDYQSALFSLRSEF